MASATATPCLICGSIVTAMIAATMQPKTSESTVMKAPMPMQKGQMLEPGKESMLPSPSAMVASSRSSKRGPGTRPVWPQKKATLPLERRYQKK